MRNKVAVWDGVEMGMIDTEKLLDLIAEQGMTPHSASRAAGLGGTAVKDIVQSKRRNPSYATVLALAKVLSVTPEQLLMRDVHNFGTTHPRIAVRDIGVVGLAEPGLWREAATSKASGVGDSIKLDVQGYEHATLWAVRVGERQQLGYPPGRIAVYADPSVAGLRVGDFVLVERYQGGLIERTIREIGGSRENPLMLSCDPGDESRDPIPYGGELRDVAALKVVGVVVADYSARDRSGPSIG